MQFIEVKYSEIEREKEFRKTTEINLLVLVLENV